MHQCWAEQAKPHARNSRRPEPFRQALQALQPIPLPRPFCETRDEPRTPAMSPERTIVALQLPATDSPMPDAPVAAPVAIVPTANAQAPEARSVDAQVQNAPVPDATVSDAPRLAENEDEDGSVATTHEDSPEDEIQIHIAASSSPPKKDASDSKRYPVHKILDFRRTDDGVDLLVRCGGNWLRDEPTWEPEEVLWNSCRQKVVKFWSPNGWNRRNRLLKLDPVAGPFTVNRILGERKIRKSKGREDGGMAYLVEFLGYERPKWKAGLEAIEERKARHGRKAKS